MVETSKFGKTKGTAVVTKKDGTKIFIKDSKIVKEVSPEGKQRVRVRVAPLGTGARRKGVPAGEFVKDLPGIALQEKKRIVEAEKRKFQQEQARKQAEAAKKAEQQRKIRQTQSLRQALITGKPTPIMQESTFVLKSFLPARQQELKNTITRLDKSPYSPSVKKELRLLAKSYDPKVQSQKTLPQVRVQGNLVPYRTAGEKKFYQKLNNVWERDKRLKGRFEDVTNSLKLNIKDTDKWYTRALKGVGTAGVGILFTGEFLANAVDISLLQGKAMFSGDVIRQANKRATISTLKKVPKAVGESFDPRKPENWANIALVLGGVRGAKTVSIKGKRFVTPKKATSATVSKALFKKKTNLAKTKAFVKEAIKKKVNVIANKKLLRRINGLESSISQSLRIFNKIKRKPASLTNKEFTILVESTKKVSKANRELRMFIKSPEQLRQLAFKKKEISKRQVARKAKEFRKEIEGKRVKAKRTLTKKELAVIRQQGRKLNKLIDDGVIKSNADLAKSIKPLVRGKVKPIFEAEVARRLATKARKAEISKRQVARKAKEFRKEIEGKRVKAKRTLTKKEIKQAKQLERLRRRGVIKAPAAPPAKTFNTVFREQPVVKGLKVERQIQSVAIRNKAPSNIVIKKNNVIVRAKKTRGNTYTVKDVVGKVSSSGDGSVTVSTATRQQVVLAPLETVKKSTVAQKRLVSQANKLKRSESLKMLPRKTIAEIKEYNRLLRLAEKQTVKQQQTILQSTKFERLSQKYKNVLSKGDFKGVKVIGLPKRITLAGLVSSLGLKDKQKLKAAQKPKTVQKPRLAISTITRLSLTQRNKLANLQKPIVATDEKLAQEQLLKRLNILERISKTKKPRKLKLKKRSSPKEKKEINEFVKKAPKVYRPSFAAIILGITAYKVPKSITGTNIRPIVIKKR